MTGLFSPEFFADPYPFYSRLREAQTLQYDNRLGWMVTHYDDVRALAKSGLLSRAKFESQRLVGLPAEVCLPARPVMDGFNLEMMRRDPGLALDGSALEWVSNPAYRGLKALPVKLQKDLA